MSPWTARCVVVALLLAVALAARGAAAADCLEGISEANAKALFDGLAGARPSDGCTLENVTTDHAQMRVEWKKGARLQEEILIVPTSCLRVRPPNARGKLAAIVPAGTEDACPAAVAATRQLAEGGPLGDLVPLVEAIPIPDLDGRPHRRWKRYLAPAAGGLAAAAALAGGIVALRRKRKRAAANATPAPLPPLPVPDPGPAPTPEAIPDPASPAATEAPPGPE